ncbi:MAG TPA: M28 family peptidase [Ktedonobacteraceae bacterium]|nr:M28 family peptidase [Ktedonobacteraceae bacterium]
MSRHSRACLLWLPILTLIMTLTPTAFAIPQVAPSGQQATTAVPGIDANYIYQQLDYMATHFLRREAGYDTNLPSVANGHDEFANYWVDQMLSLLGTYGAVASRYPFPVQGWKDRPTPVPAVNVEVTVPGVSHPEQEVIIGCHYDGMAFSSQSAYDDGSGCAIELGVAKAMGEFWNSNHVYPARTLRFVLFDAEEQGLYGSYYYVNNTINGDLKNVVAMFNEEQNGIAYPLRYLGSMSNPLMPYYIDMSPLQSNKLYDQSKLTARQRANIVQFRQLMQQAVVAAFQQFRSQGDQMLTYHNGHGKDVWQPIFTPDQLGYIHQEDDTMGSSDQMPFTMAGLPCATLVGNSTYYDPNAPPGSYPYDQPQDTIQLMNIFASGNSQQSQALTLALGLPGMLTTWMLSQPAILGQVPADGKPIAALSDIGLARPGRPMSFASEAAYDPTQQGSSLSYRWDFGDGSGASGRQVSHTYASAGTYTLSLTVTSPAGGTRIITKQISVGTPPAYDNPYARYPLWDGMPSSNPAVILPQATPGLSDRVGTVAEAQQQGPLQKPTTATTTSSIWNGGTLWVILSGLLLLLILGGVAVATRRK